MIQYYRLFNKVVATVHEPKYITRYVTTFGTAMDDAQADVDILVMPAYHWSDMLSHKGQLAFRNLLATWSGKIFPAKIIYSGDNEGIYNLQRASTVEKIIHVYFPNVPVRFVTQNKVAADDHGWFLGHGFFIETYNDVLHENQVVQENMEPKRFLCLGGCPRPNKQFVFCLLLNSGLLDDDITCWSFAKLRIDLGKAWEQSLHPKHAVIVNAYPRLLKLLPKRIDTDDCGNKKGIIKLNPNLMARGKLHIVVETDLGDGQYQQRITEKTLKSIATQKPFIIFGCPFALKYLHQLGFKTFDDVFDESYDTITDDIDRCEHVTSIIEKMSKLSNTEFDNMLDSCKEACVHNYHKMISLSFQRQQYSQLFEE